MIKFGDYILDSEHSCLLNASDNSEILIEPKLFELLLLFIERPNAVISRQDILEELWAGSVVTDNAINKLIGNLRKLLGDDAKKPNYIQTVPKKGYRLVCSVEALGSKASNPTDSNLINDPPSEIAPVSFWGEKLKAYIMIYFIVILVIVLSALMIFKSSNNNSSNISYSVALTRDEGAELSPIMHPNNKHLYYLKENDDHESRELWIKNINTSVTKKAKVKGSISKIISLVEDLNANQTIMFYLDMATNKCGLYQEFLSAPEELNQISTAQKKLFDCSDKRVKDIDYHDGQNAFYYAAQPKNHWPNQIYAFDVETGEHKIVTQSQPKGWGHHNLDISPNGKKLLIMSTDSDYKTQLLSLNLSDNKITKGMKFEKPVYEAIWHHDSEQVYYFAPPPAQRIIRSDINGETSTEVINISEEILPKLSRIADGKNILFSTENKNYNNRWLMPLNNNETIDNSSVFDVYPALFHKSDKYLFVSKRSGRMQLYLVNNQYNQAKVVTNLPNSHWLKYVSISEEDKNVLLNVDNKVYLVPISELDPNKPLTAFKEELLIYESKNPIISLDWLTSQSAAITHVINGTPELVVVQLSNNKKVKFDGTWAYGLKDSEQPELVYFIEQHSNVLYQASYSSLGDKTSTEKLSFINTQISLPTDFYHVKVDSNNLYYVNAENDTEYLYVVPINRKSESWKLPLSNFSSYDVSKGRIIVSDSDILEGDVHRTMY
ncbi:winged helix-turn-helix domain-containing protein [Pseudoalteromonas sp. T1lg48]|uniref:winged helix-turn-helix domain-containing protein n=1 Tax=Pseudoalteromonas sp. T1lg48 TaxID=2077100 RepID=UPI000CF6AF19|nr:winged helix-turn-helix domain-containing protein [Pseudoalteromonas sp. T1lg48]